MRQVASDTRFHPVGVTLLSGWQGRPGGGKATSPAPWLIGMSSPPIWRAPTDQRIPCCSFTGESPDGLSRYRLLPLGADESGDGIGGFGEFFFGFGATGFGRADHAVAHMVIQ